MEKNVEIVEKARIFLYRNGKIAIMYWNSTGTFMLPGGKKEKNESLENGLIREVKEETGIQIKEEDITDFLHTQTLEKENGNEKVITRFYIINATEDFNKESMKLSEREKNNGVKPYWVNPSILEYRLEYLANNKDEESAKPYVVRYAREFLKAYKAVKEYNARNNGEIER